MFGISDPNIIEHGEAGEVSGNEHEQYVRMARNQTEPDMIVDGVDSMEILYEPGDRFRVEYWGYMSGRLWVTQDGVAELKQTFLDDQNDIPGWTLSTDLTELPDWFPTPESVPSPVTCDDCGSDVPVTEVVTPWLAGSHDRFCPDCWASVGEEL